MAGRRRFPPDWRARRAAVLDRDGWRCVACGVPVHPRCSPVGCVACAHVDHIVPRDAGGSDELGNLRALCAGHNMRRARTGPGELPRASRPLRHNVHRLLKAF
jgi:5-methylcytosine-specific restriction protein A